MKYSKYTVPLTILSVFLALPTYAVAEEQIVIERVAPDAVEEQNPLYQALTKDMVAGEKVEHIRALRNFYNARGFEPYWSGDWFGLNGNGDALIEILEESWTHGLNPYAYHLEVIRELKEKDSEQARIDLDVLLSDAYVRYGQDMSGIRVNPEPLHSHRRFWQQPIKAEVLLGGLQNDVKDAVAAFSPQGQTYKRLREELIALSEGSPEPYEAVLPISIDGLLNPYEEHSAVPDLRIRLGLSGASNSFVYDDQLASAVMRFQKEHHLKADGIVGPSTLQALNLSRAQKIKRLIANLERLRWVPDQKPEKFVVVNIPSAKLWAVDDGRLEFDMDVIVGRKERPTNIFVTDITGVRFNPTWTVPPTIKEEDIVPKLIENPLYLTNKGMELIYGSGADAVTLDPTSIDWTTITESELRSLRMVQTPGAHNPLGSIRVLMPNGYNIYLHDTNEPQYFQRAARAASSGCVRMKAPEKMARFILENKRGWDEEDYQAALSGQKMKDVFINETIPIYLVYYTVWIGDDGELVYSNDLYGYDDLLIKMLSDIDGFLIPVDNNGNRMGGEGRSRLVSMQ